MTILPVLSLRIHSKDVDLVEMIQSLEEVSGANSIGTLCIGANDPYNQCV